MTYPEAIEYLNSLIDYEKLASFDYEESIKLEGMRNLVRYLGDPHSGLKCIHISGTKGKGSVSSMAASILKEAGFKVGLYTSPHLVTFRERISINGELINEQELCGLINEVRPAIDRMKKPGVRLPTFFEVYTAIAFLYFKKKKTDFCVMEVGLGGRLDATNVINPLCCGITHISLEHTQKLGNTVGEIASEKAGIIKENSICVSSPQAPAAAEVIRRVCEQKNSRMYEVGKDITFEQIDFDMDRQRFSVRGLFDNYADLEIGLLGDHQMANAATAVGLVESLRFYDIIIGYNCIREGLKKTRWAGRMQVLRRSPYVILDGAQNRASANILRLSVKKYFKYDRLILVLGISSDKDINGICEELGPMASEIILTKSDNPRAAEPAVLQKYLSAKARVSRDVKEAMEMAEALAGPSDLILVTGSLYVVGEVLKLK